MSNPVGRPPFLNEDTVAEFNRLLPACLYVETCCDIMGITRFAVRKWLRRGMKEQLRLVKSPNRKPKEAEAIYLKFVNVVKKAVGEQILKAIAGIQLAGKTNWTALAWIAERRERALWSMDRDRLLRLEKKIDAMQGG